VPLLVLLDAAEVVDQGGEQVGLTAGQFGDPDPAVPGGLLGVHVEEGEVAEGAVLKVLADVAGDLAGDDAGADDRGGQRARHRGINPADVLLGGQRPAADDAGRLPGEGLAAQQQVAELEDGAADVDGVHLLVLPGPQEGVADQVLGLRRQRHGREAGGHERLAVGDGDDLLALQGEQEEAQQQSAGLAGVAALPGLQLAHELIVDGAHRAYLVPPERRSLAAVLTVETRIV
jgi:hypothetical protein